jgi:DNA polymerase-1
MEGETVDIEPWDEATCQKFIDKWYNLNPEVKDFQMERAAEARRYGYVQDMFGRIRYIPEITCPVRSIQEAGVRQAANFPVTASAQGIIKLAMGELWRELPKKGWRNNAVELMQIHDSLLYQLDDDPDFIREFVSWMRQVMCGVVKLAVPVKVDFKLGKKWGELSKYSEK